MSLKNMMGALAPPPDLSILSKDIVFSNTNPVSGEEVTIYATIHNVGQGQASDVMVIFYLDKITPLGTQTVASIPPGDSQNVAVEWTATQSGSHVVTVLVDAPADSNENNNIATRAIIVQTVPSTPLLNGPSVCTLYDEHDVYQGPWEYAASASASDGGKVKILFSWDDGSPDTRSIDHRSIMSTRVPAMRETSTSSM